MIEDGTGEHQSVEQRHSHADRDSFLHLAQHAAGRRSVDVKIPVFAAVRCRDHKRLAIDQKSYVADEAFVEDTVRGLAIINSTFGFADYTRSLGWHLSFRHGGTDSGASAKDG